LPFPKKGKADRRPICLFRKKGKLIAVRFAFSEKWDGRSPSGLTFAKYGKADRRQDCLFV
jgi:hypothetical protein